MSFFEAGLEIIHYVNCMPSLVGWRSDLNYRKKYHSLARPVQRLLTPFPNCTRFIFFSNKKTEQLSLPCTCRGVYIAVRLNKKYYFGPITGMC
jgi:hypothetical protein